MQQQPYRIIIAGGRDFHDAKYLQEKMNILLIGLSDFPYKISFVSGMAKGADMVGKAFAKHLGVKCEEYPADWEKFGKGAGFIRNRQMAENAEALVAFWDGKSSGTKHMINTATALGLDVFIFRY